MNNTQEVYVEESGHLIKVRNLRRDDYNDVIKILKDIYGKETSIWKKEQFEKLLRIFPEGQIGIEDKGKLVAYVLSIIVDYQKYGDEHTYDQIIGNGEFNTHDPNGDIMYGIDVCVHPKQRGLRLGRRLYDARKEVCENMNLKGIVAGGRMPNYHLHANQLKPKEYIDKVKSKELFDPVLTFQLSNDFHVIKVLKGYLPQDRESQAFATLLEWNNIYYSSKPKVLGAKKTYVRIGLMQWQMRNVRNLDSFFDNVEFFVDAVSRYQADFLLFPEFFNMPLLADFNEEDSAKAIRKLAKYTEKIRDKLVEFAVSYNINIIGGSMPLYKDKVLYNVAYLCKRDGTWDMQTKIHATPTEKSIWGIKGGDEIKVFDTDVGKIGILICYDIEFPELSRIMADQGVQIIFVPFSTDSNNGYQRVRKCAEARAVENECYVAIAGSVGNLPKVRNMNIQFAQSAVFSPSDFAFPSYGVVAEGTPNSEMTIIADVDFDLLKELHIHGSVNNLLDRRTDLYEIKWKKDL